MSYFEFFETAAKFAPLGTTFVALGAAVIALRAIYIQRDVARRRAAIDFFLRTEIDKETIALYERFKKINVVHVRSTPMPIKMEMEEYKDARQFLNICELIAVGVRHGAFSERVSRAYWGDVLPNSYNKMASFIRDIRSTDDEGGSQTYIDLERLCERWSKQPLT